MIEYRNTWHGNTHGWGRDGGWRGGDGEGRGQRGDGWGDGRGRDDGGIVGGPSKQSFTYDDLYRLTGAQGTYSDRFNGKNSYRLSMSYDSIHNITNKQQVNTLKHRDDEDILRGTTYNYTYAYKGTKPHAASTTGPFTLRYDANGNLVRRETKFGWDDDKRRRVLVWDEENRLACVRDNEGDDFWRNAENDDQRPERCREHGEGDSPRFIYDATGTRVFKEAGQVSITINPNFTEKGERSYKHIFVGTQRLLTKLAESRHDWDDGGEDNRGGWWRGDDRAGRRGDYERKREWRNRRKEDDRWGRDRDRRSDWPQWYYHTNHIQSTSYVTNGNGELTEYLDYFPSGETWIQERDSLPVQYMFTSAELDTETGYYYFGQRYLSPRTSTWISADPALGRGDYTKSNSKRLFNSISMAIYTYASNNPVKYIDPDGDKDYPFSIYQKIFFGSVTKYQKKFTEYAFYADHGGGKYSKEVFLLEADGSVRHSFTTEMEMGANGQLKAKAKGQTRDHPPGQDHLKIEVLLGHRDKPDNSGGPAEKYESYDLISGEGNNREFVQEGGSKNYKLNKRNQPAHPGASLTDAINEKAGAPDHDKNYSTRKELKDVGVKLSEE